MSNVLPRYLVDMAEHSDVPARPAASPASSQTAHRLTPFHSAKSRWIPLCAVGLWSLAADHVSEALGPDRSPSAGTRTSQ